ncbi:unnamed protein product [Strongylus vulgaris]|uniref:EF-hand domain-containing protein n=1 Tax=Strongylus vulgaris TaxID=40348 RepID=A0A3P7LYV4_STRVU|nr:unnamed protein product [Strongylus vulgaris]
MITFKDIFGESVAESLWKFLSDSRPDDAKLSFQEFSRHAASLMGTSTDVYVVVFQPLLHLIRVCSEAAGAGAVSGDEQFLANLAKEMVSIFTEENTGKFYVVSFKTIFLKFCL